jgi:hypothetical protein
MLNSTPSYELIGSTKKTQDCCYNGECVPPLNGEPIVFALPNRYTIPTIDDNDLARTDKFFEEHGDIVSVFDHDQPALVELKLQRDGDLYVERWHCLCWGCGLGCLLSYVDGKNWLAIGFALVIFATRILVIPAKRRDFQALRKRFEDLPDSDWPHTAITRTGVRHVEPPTHHRGGCVLDIPFEDIVSIEMFDFRESTFTWYDVTLTLTAADDGIKYISSGYHRFERWQGQIKVPLHCLKEPVRFRKLVAAMTDKLSTPASKAAQLLLRVEACMEAVDNPGTVDPKVKQVLSNLVDELRDFKETHHNVTGELNAATLV